MALEDHVRLDGLRPILLNGREEVVFIGAVQGRNLPLLQLFNDKWVEWNRLPGRFRLGVAFDVVPNGMGDVSLHKFKGDLAESQNSF
jgi:hypothetical protein